MQWFQFLGNSHGVITLQQTLFTNKPRLTFLTISNFNNQFAMSSGIFYH